MIQKHVKDTFTNEIDAAVWLDWARHPYGPLFFEAPVPLAYCQSLPAGSLVLPAHVLVCPPLERTRVMPYSDSTFSSAAKRTFPVTVRYLAAQDVAQENGWICT
jgi:hypothetical protein